MKTSFAEYKGSAPDFTVHPISGIILNEDYSLIQADCPDKSIGYFPSFVKSIILFRIIFLLRSSYDNDEDNSTTGR